MRAWLALLLLLPGLIAALRSMLAKQPKAGNLVLALHGSTILALTGVSPGTGEMVVVTPQGGGRFSVAGGLAVD